MGFNLQLGDALRSENAAAIDDAIRSIFYQEIRSMSDRAKSYPELAADLFRCGFEAGAADAKAEIEVLKFENSELRKRLGITPNPAPERAATEGEGAQRG